MSNRHFWNRFIFIVLLACTTGLFLPSAVLPASAHSQAKAVDIKDKITKSPCTHLVVYLHGKHMATTKCLDGAVSSGNGHQTANITVGCDDYSLVLFWDGNLSGATVCLEGSGWINLTSLCAPWYLGGCANSWNDQVSSFDSRDTPGFFYRDTNLGNYMFSFSVFTQQNLYGSNNDSISSVATQSCNPNDNPDETADHYISRCLRGSVRGRFPGGLLGYTIRQIFACAAAGNRDCITARKLLTDKYYKK